MVADLIVAPRLLRRRAGCDADFASGTFDGAQAAAVGDGAITFGTSAGTLAYDDPFDSTTETTTYDYDASSSRAGPRIPRRAH